MDPVPLVVVAGEGSGRGALQRRIDVEELPVRLVGCRDDIADLLSVADVALLPSRWEARSLLAQEALRLGTPWSRRRSAASRNWWATRRN